MLGWSLNENLGAGSEVTARQLPDFWPLGNPTLSTFILHATPYLWVGFTRLKLDARKLELS